MENLSEEGRKKIESFPPDVQKAFEHVNDWIRFNLTSAVLGYMEHLAEDKDNDLDPDFWTNLHDDGHHNYDTVEFVADCINNGGW